MRCGGSLILALLVLAYGLVEGMCQWLGRELIEYAATPANCLQNMAKALHAAGWTEQLADPKILEHVRLSLPVVSPEQGETTRRYCGLARAAAEPIG